MLGVLLAAAMTFASSPVLAAESPPAPPPMTADQMLGELRTHLNALFHAMKKSPLQNPEQCQKVMGTIRAYTKRNGRSFTRIRAFQRTMAPAVAKRLEKLLSTIMVKYSDVYMKFSEGCHKELDEFEELMDGLTAPSGGKRPAHDHDEDEHEHGEDPDHPEPDPDPPNPK